MAKKTVTIAGVKYEIDTEDPSYKKRLSPEEYSLKEDSQKVWNKTKEIAKFVASPEFVKYIVPGINTKAFAEDAVENVNNAYTKLKEGKYRQAIGDTFYAAGNVLNGVASLAPFAGIFLPKGPAGYKVTTVTSPGSVNLTNSGKQATKQFSGSDLFQHGKKKLQRTLTDAEYSEALQKRFPQNYKQLQQAQLDELNKTIVNWDLPPDNGWIMSTERPTFSIPGGYECSASEFKSILKSQFPNLSAEEALDQLGVPDKFKKQFFSGKPTIKVDDSVLEALQHQTDLNQEQLRKLFFHEGTHATGAIAPTGTNYITSHNSKFPVNGKSTSVPSYYLEPDEIRARAMSIRRLHQATGESYEDILNNWNTGKYRPDPNIDDLLEYYDRESLLNYLNNFLKSGGKLNYTKYFK